VPLGEGEIDLFPLGENKYHGRRQVETRYFQARLLLLNPRHKESVEKREAPTLNHGDIILDVPDFR
jgi:hypothetical protein